MALWDLKGKLLDLPLHRLLGGADADAVGAASTAPPYSQPGSGGEDVPAYASGTAFQDATTLKSPDRLAAESDAVVQRGFHALKLGWGAHFGDEDRGRLAAVRDAIGPDVRLMLDVGCPAYWSALTVAAHLHILASVGAGGMVEYPGFDALPESTAVPAHIAQFEIVEHPPELVDGRLRLPGRPGLGLGNFVAEGVRGLEAGGRC